MPHPELARVLAELGAQLLAAGRPVQAAAVLQRVLGAYSAAFGPSHPLTAVILGGFGAALTEMGREEEGLVACVRAVGVLAGAFPAGWGRYGGRLMGRAVGVVETVGSGRFGAATVDRMCEVGTGAGVFGKGGQDAVIALVGR